MQLGVIVTDSGATLPKEVLDTMGNIQGVLLQNPEPGVLRLLAEFSNGLGLFHVDVPEGKSFQKNQEWFISPNEMLDKPFVKFK